jgi:hypothetical protein
MALSAKSPHTRLRGPGLRPTHRGHFLDCGAQCGVCYAARIGHHRLGADRAFTPSQSIASSPCRAATIPKCCCLLISVISTCSSRYATVLRTRGCCCRELLAMPVRKCPVLIESHKRRSSAGFSAVPSAQPVEISLALREMGWTAYRVRFDAAAVAWVASVIDWGIAA